MLTTHSIFNNLLRERGVTSEIYDAMESDDYADVVMATLKSLQKSLNFPRFSFGKCEEKSNEYRCQGNKAFKDGLNGVALELYNRALMYAPNKSRSMALAIGNRSAILLHSACYDECLNDIEMCFRLGCPPDTVEKLNKRKEVATVNKRNDAYIIESVRKHCKRFLQVDKCHAEIPCVSADVDVVVKDGVAFITAATDMKVGTLVAVETSFVGSNDPSNTALACHYCHKLAYNLIPCDGCCFVMFCNENCKRTCMSEYHGIECQIMGVVDNTIHSPAARLMLKGALKFVHMCGTWKEAIEESHTFGTKRQRVSTTSEMFDVYNKLSVLNYDDENIFVHGAMYAASFVCAAIIHNLDGLPSYLPQSPRERVLAKRALARIMMYLVIYAKPTQVIVHQWTNRKKGTLAQAAPGHGLYPFIGKLKNSCTPNLVVAHLGNRAALIVLRPIKKGSELTFSHVGHYLNTKLTPYLRNCMSFIMYGAVCNCFVCSGKWKTRSEECSLSVYQRAFYERYITNKRNHIDITTLSTVYPKICEALSCLSNVPFSKEYINIYTEFRMCLSCTTIGYA